MGSRAEGCRQDFWLKQGRNGALGCATELPSQEISNDKPEKPSEAGSVCRSHLLQRKAVSGDTFVKKKVYAKGGCNMQLPPLEAAPMPLAVGDLRQTISAQSQLLLPGICMVLLVEGTSLAGEWRRQHVLPCCHRSPLPLGDPGLRPAVF